MNASVVDEHEGRGAASAALVLSILKLALAGAFIFAGIFKLEDPATFEVTLIHWRLFPDNSIGALTWGVPLVEIVAGCAYLSSRWGRLGLQVLLSLTTVYTLLLVVQWIRGIPSDCGCFGAISAGWPYYALVSRNVGLIMVGIVLIAFDSSQQPSTSAIARGLR
jgi:uncharacterized membrane protein YphA (DoxX/SURF4 family)